MGRRRRKVIKIPKKKLPKVFKCVYCGAVAVRVTLGEGGSKAHVRCGNCGAEGVVDLPPGLGAIDAYSKWVDEFYKQFE